MMKGSVLQMRRLARRIGPLCLGLLVLAGVIAGCEYGQDSFTQDKCPEATDSTSWSQVLSLINQARGQAHNCGGQFYPVAPAVTWNDLLTEAAHRHSSDMATRDFFDHPGSDGTNVADRVTATGYKWGLVAENLLVGTDDPMVVIQEWVDSPGHCKNLMNAEFTEIGLSAVQGNYGGRQTSYWTLVLAKPNCVSQ